VHAAVAAVEIEAVCVEAPVLAEQRVAAPEPVAPTPLVAALHAVPRAERQSLNQMMDRLSAGLDRRVRDAERGAPPLPPRQPPRDMRPALREALDELNRLATRRD